MENLIYDEGGLWVYVVVTVILGGGGAFSTGRALARSWHDWPMVILGMAGLAFGVRFIHYALFQEMTTQYRWLYERTGPLSWAERPENATANHD